MTLVFRLSKATAPWGGDEDFVARVYYDFVSTLERDCLAIGADDEIGT